MEEDNQAASSTLSYSRHMHPIWLQVSDYWWWFRCDECNRPGFSPWGAGVFTLLLTWGKHYMCLALWRPEDPKVIAICQRHHSALSPFLMVCHCLFATVYLSLLNCIILVFPAALTQCSTTSTLCNITLWKRSVATATDKNKPNVENTRYSIGGKCVLKAEFL